MNFFKTILNTIYSPEFYSFVYQKPFKQSISYFLLLTLLLTLVQSITLIKPLLIEAPAQIQTLIRDAIDCFPKNLEIKVTNGQVTTNVSEPYFITSCKAPSGNQALVVIDTKTPFSITQFDEYKTPIWVTKDAVFTKKTNSEVRSYTLTKIKDFKLDKDLLNSLSNKISPWIKFVGPILFVLAFIVIYSGYNFRLIYLLLLSAIIALLSKFLKRSLTLGQSYKVGLYAITLGLLVELAVSLTSRMTNFHGFPFMVTIITLGVIIANLFIPKNTD